MADINYEDLEDLTLTMEDEDGTTTECELQFVFEYDGQDYGAFCEAENEDSEFYFFSIDGEVNKKGEIQLEIAPVEDDALLEQLVDILQQIIDSEMSDIDVEDADDAEDDEDDSIWDEFINKKLEDYKSPFVQRQDIASRYSLSQRGFFYLLVYKFY